MRGLGKPQQPGIRLHCVEALLDPANRCVPFNSRMVVTAGPKFPSFPCLSISVHDFIPSSDELLSPHRSSVFDTKTIVHPIPVYDFGLGFP